MIPTRSRTNAADSAGAADESDAAYLRDRAAQARRRMRTAWRQFGAAARSAANPRKLMRYHPIGTTVAVGVVAAIAARSMTGKPREPRPSRGLLAEAFRVVRSTLVQSIISQTIVAALATPGEAADDSHDPCTEPPT